ncbi:uncharacterized protein YgiB involved in biofilm formation [Limimaricola variabilis]|jgi:uncharacterized protein YgiB involved in biofilm formation|uniref:Uncharacterized protein YgiB involved in biofilm formation n=1 Tax=Limimaricola variabilis TaxID=1492771 RepID=A0ABR6HK63_9RHOB|nr:DUF1190 domain-containing protein [Limimaricola variabilis]MBB3710816.1 uncharacterized protein YgiB involved in biofilm formation [Limimaricola variabilis]
MSQTSAATPATTSKRSRHVRIALLGAAAFSLAACREEDVPSAAFPTLDACLEAAAGPGTWVTEESCEEGFGQALEAHVETAPRYDDQALCEAEHGGECVAEERPGGGGSIFLPLMAGYLIGNMLGGRGSMAQPFYGRSSGGFATPGGTVLNQARGTTSLSPNAFRAGTPTRTAAPMTRATVNRTGGFGATRTGTGVRSFGG